MSGFARVVDACHDGLIESIEALDEELESATGLSSLRNSFLLEVLATIAIVMGNYELVKALVVKGSPPAREQTPHTWVYREDSRTMSLELVALLLREHWLHPLDSHAYSLVHTTDSAAAVAMFDALVARGFFLDFDRIPYFWQLGVQSAPIESLRHIAMHLPPRDALAGAWNAQSLARAAYRRANATDVLDFLLENMILDIHDETHRFHEPSSGALPINSLPSMFVNYTETALHVAVQANRAENVRWLLEHGAKIRRDAAGYTPYERAVRYDCLAVVDFFKLYFEEKRLPVSYVDGDETDSV